MRIATLVLCVASVSYLTCSFTNVQFLRLPACAVGSPWKSRPENLLIAIRRLLVSDVVYLSNGCPILISFPNSDFYPLLVSDSYLPIDTLGIFFWVELESES